ncbi:MAG: glycosyltransferase family 1 protein [Parcubacteria group bacterium]|jgi:glycosyltransferase involved in cell wall biosynthesis
MRIGIDARFYGPFGKGLGRYTQKLIENLEQIDEKNEYFIFLRKENFEDYAPKNTNFKKVMANYRWYTFEEQIKMPFLLKRYKLDLVHFPHFNVPIFYWGKFLITIHDLILIHFPTIRGTTLHPFFYKIKFLAYRFAINSAIRRARKVIAVSEFTRKDILRNYAVREQKVETIFEACDGFCLTNLQSPEEALKKYGLVDSRGIIKPYIVYIGNVYPHKNPESLALGFALAKKEYFPDLNLVFIGGEDYFYLRLKKFIGENGIKDVIFAGGINDQELSGVLRSAVLYGRPSFYEGFELPPLEAMACGVPVICSDHECAHEILEDSALYFNPHDPQSIAEAIQEVLTDENLRRNLVRKGYAQVRKYDWKLMAEKTLKIYNGLDKNEKQKPCRQTGK